MNKEEYAIFPGQIKINNCTYFGIAYELTDFVNHLAEQNKKYKEAIDKIIEIINYYGVDKEYNDNVILRNILKDMLDILNEALK